VFLGEYKHSVDAKGRVVLPSRFRDDLAEGCVVTKGQERCLFVFPINRWETEMTQVSELPRTNARNRQYARSFFASAIQQDLDKQGRVQIPQNLRDYAGLGKDIAVLGVSDRVEIWDAAEWLQYNNEADEAYSSIEEALSDQGI